MRKHHARDNRQYILWFTLQPLKMQPSGSHCIRCSHYFIDQQLIKSILWPQTTFLTPADGDITRFLFKVPSCTYSTVCRAVNEDGMKWKWPDHNHSMGTSHFEGLQSSAHLSNRVHFQSFVTQVFNVYTYSYATITSTLRLDRQTHCCCLLLPYIWKINEIHYQ